MNVGNQCDAKGTIDGQNHIAGFNDAMRRGNLVDFRNENAGLENRGSENKNARQFIWVAAAHKTERRHVKENPPGLVSFS